MIEDGAEVAVDEHSIQARAVIVPACKVCAGHLKGNVWAAFASLLAWLGALGVAFGLFVHLYPIAIGAGLILAIGAALLINGPRSRRKLAAAGHHAGLEIQAGTDQCLIRTTNPRVAVDLVERHAAVVHRATLPAE